jgi:hypothetical protein
VPDKLPAKVVDKVIDKLINNLIKLPLDPRTHLSNTR